MPPALEVENRLLIEIQGADTQKLGTSSYNMAHVQYPCQVACEAMCDTTLEPIDGTRKTILIIPFYTAQVRQYSKALDSMVTEGPDHGTESTTSALARTAWKYVEAREMPDRGNAFDNRYLALDKAGQQRVQVPLEGILTDKKYYFIVDHTTHIAAILLRRAAT